MAGIALAYVGNGDAVLLQVRLDVRGVAIGRDADCFVHHHLKDEMRAAFEIQTEVDAAENRGLERRSTNTLGNTNDSEDENDQNGEDQNGFGREILTHGNRMK